jgi:glycine/D-amino acid oxidase-like deaminating enzyme
VEQIPAGLSRRALPRSLYADTAGAAPVTPPLEGDVRADVVVVGGGFTGLSAALHLAEKGVSVRVLEANEVGWGASGRNGGQVNPGLKFDPDQIEADFGPGMGRRMVAFSAAAPQRVFDLVERHQIVCEARQGGTIRAAKTARNAAVVQASAAKWGAIGAPVRLLDAAAMQAATGTAHYLCGMSDPRGGNVNPLGYARGLAGAAQRAGAVIHGASPATGMARVADGWRVTTPGGAVTADWLVLCTNGYTDGLWPGLKRSVIPVFSMIAATEPLSDALAAAVMPCRSVLFEVASMTVYYRLDAWNRLLMGGRSPQLEAVGRPAYDYLIRYTERLWPQLKGIGWSHFWNGQLAISTDHYPHFHEPAPGVLAALAYNGRGVAMATAMGTQIANRVLGAAADTLDMPVTTMKTIPMHGLWRTAVSGRMAYGRIREALGL